MRKALIIFFALSQVAALSRKRLSKRNIECAPAWSEEWTLQMGKALKEAFANDAEDNKYRISNDPCIPVLAKPVCKALPSRIDTEWCRIGLFAQQNYKGNLKAGSRTLKCSIIFDRVKRDKKWTIKADIWKNECQPISDLPNPTIAETTTKSTAKPETCDLNCLNGKCVFNQDGSKTCECDQGFKIEKGFWDITCVPDEPVSISPPTTKMTTTTATTTTTAIEINDGGTDQKCSLECENGKCIIESSFFGKEKCECDSGYSYNSWDKICEQDMVEPPVVTPETEEDACSLKCGVGECTIQKGGFFWSTKELCECPDGYEFESSTCVESEIEASGDYYSDDDELLDEEIYDEIRRRKRNSIRSKNYKKFMETFENPYTA